jgi:hypothetical protein
VVPGRNHTEPSACLADRDQTWWERIEWATQDLSGPCHHRQHGARRNPGGRPSSSSAAGNSKLDEWRRPVQNKRLPSKPEKLCAVSDATLADRADERHTGKCYTNCLAC